MDRFVTIKTFTYATELAIIRGRLESEGIECFAQDELTVQANPFYSNAIGGIKLQVREHDIKKAVEILKETGYLKDEDYEPTPFYRMLDDATSEFPFIRKMPVEYRLLILAAIFLPLIMLVVWQKMQG